MACPQCACTYTHTCIRLALVTWQMQWLSSSARETIGDMSTKRRSLDQHMAHAHPTVPWTPLRQELLPATSSASSSHATPSSSYRETPASSMQPPPVPANENPASSMPPPPAPAVENTHAKRARLNKTLDEVLFDEDKTLDDVLFNDP